MDRLRCLEIFAEVARGGSFRAAAQRFAISRSAVSKHVARLERLLGARLLARTTREVDSLREWAQSPPDWSAPAAALPRITPL